MVMGDEMTLKKWKKISVIIIYLIAVLLHFLYDLIPGNFTAAFLPVNESVWEHLKMTLNAYLIFSILEYIILKKKNFQVNNYIFSLLTSSLGTILMTIVLFYPLFYTFGENVIVTQIIYLISIIFGTYLSFKVLTETTGEKILNILSALILLFFEFGFIYLTFNPRVDDIFIDKPNNKIGLYSYNPN